MQHVTELNQSMVESLMHHQGQGVPHHTQGPPAVRAKLQGAHAAVQRGTRHKRSQTAQTGAGCGAAMSQSQGCSVAATCLQSGGAYVAGVHRLQVWGPVREKGLPDAPQGSRLLEVCCLPWPQQAAVRRTRKKLRQTALTGDMPRALEKGCGVACQLAGDN